MTIYIFTLVLVIGLGLTLDNEKCIKIGSRELTTHNRKIKCNTLYVYGVGMWLIFVCGVRAITVGPDTYMYYTIFNMSKEVSASMLSSYLYNMEIGYSLFCALMSKIVTYRVFLFVCSLISIAPTIFIIDKYSENKKLSLLLYVCFSYWLINFTALRQCIAIGFCMLAFNQLMERHLLKFIFLVLFASTFHITALVFLPAYLVHFIPYNNWFKGFSLMLIALAFLFRDSFFVFLSMFSRLEYSSLDAGSQRMFLFMLLCVILIFIYYKKNKPFSKELKIYTYFMIASTILCTIALIHPALNRIYFYYHVFITLFVPLVLKSIQDKRTRLLINAAFVVVAVYFFVSQGLNDVNKYVPYYFYWQKSL